MHRRNLRFLSRMLCAVVIPALSWGCFARLSSSTDTKVYRTVADRQRAALGFTSDMTIESPKVGAENFRRMYRFAPRPLGRALPKDFTRRAGTNDTSDFGDPNVAKPGIGEGDITGRETDTGEATAEEAEESDSKPGRVFDLRQTLSYAERHARDLQNAKEDLYLAALDLTLERHLWTPQFSTTVTSEFEDFEADAELDQAQTSVAEIAVRQRLPLGGELAARVVTSFVNDLDERVTTGESGQLILEANIPLFRGAGRVAYESRYVAERELIYAVRTYERFRRSFLVTVASNYFSVQQRRTAIANTEKSYKSRMEAWEKADFTERMGRSKTVFDASRAQSTLRDAEVALSRAREEYQTAMDRFKILLGMPVVEQLDVPDQSADKASQSLDGLLTEVSVEEAIETALTYRLDLLNDADRVDDARRGVVIAENRILPDLDFTANLLSNSNPDHLSTTTQNTFRTSWRAGLAFRLDDRRTEIRDYRSSQVALRRVQRSHEEFVDRVRADVRRAMRRIEQTADVRQIQEMNVTENERRLEAATVQYNLGKQTNQDVVDAETDLLAARNDYADAVAAFRIAILESRRDTGTLRVSADGSWVQPGDAGP